MQAGIIVRSGLLTPALGIARSTSYQAACFGPVEEKRDLFCELRDEITRLVDEHANRDLIARREAELERIPIEPKWADAFHNLVVTAGLNDSLEKHLKGSGYTATWYVGLTGGTPTFAAGNTMASHAGWTEVHTQYSQTERPTLTLGTVSGGSVDNSASKAVFGITGSATTGGAFVASDDTKNGSTGVLYGGGPYTEGDRSVQNGDTVNVTVTATAAAS